MSYQELFKKFDEAIQKIRELKETTECAVCKQEIETFEKGLEEIKNLYNVMKEYKDGQRIKNKILEEARVAARTAAEARSYAEQAYPKKDVLGIRQLLNELTELHPRNVTRELGLDEIARALTVRVDPNSNDTLAKELFPVPVTPLTPIPYGILKRIRNGF